MLLVWKFIKGTKFVKASEMDIWTGRREAEGEGDDTHEKDGNSLFKKLQDIVVG